jgi:hypothetical protein
MWHPFLRDLTHYSKKDTMDLFFPIKMYKTSVEDSIRVYDKKTLGWFDFVLLFGSLILTKLHLTKIIIPQSLVYMKKRMVQNL